jgi:hypothetical protein
MLPGLFAMCRVAKADQNSASTLIAGGIFLPRLARTSQYALWELLKGVSHAEILLSCTVPDQGEADL